MKIWIKRLVRWLARYNRAWLIIEALLVRPAEFAKSARRDVRLASSVSRIDFPTSCDAILADLTVRSGPLRGMCYPEARSTGSALVPKILGCYERELHEVFEEVCQQRNSAIVDIGCAEGYYAVGLAMRLPHASVHAFDTNQGARDLCQAMARKNGVLDRLTVKGLCEVDALKEISFGERAFIISDCVGCERHLFTEELAKLLAHHDLLIEVHDFVDSTISSYLSALFNETHLINVIESVSDTVKACLYYSAEISECGIEVRRQLFAENRPQVMEWFYLKSRLRKTG